MPPKKSALEKMLKQQNSRFKHTIKRRPSNLKKNSRWKKSSKKKTAPKSKKLDPARDWEWQAMLAPFKHKRSSPFKSSSSNKKSLSFDFSDEFYEELEPMIEVAAKKAFGDESSKTSKSKTSASKTSASKTSTSKKSKSKTSASKTSALKASASKSALQRMLEASESRNNVQGLKINYNRNDKIKGIRKINPNLNTLTWSRINGYLNIPNFRSKVWTRIPNDAFVICVQYRDKRNKPADIQIGITGTCKKGITSRHNFESWDNCMKREVKEEIGMNLQNPRTSFRHTKIVGNSKGNPQIWHWDSVNFDNVNKLTAVNTPVNKDLREDNKKLKIGVIVWTKNPDKFMRELEISYGSGGLNRVLDDDIISILCVPKRYIINNLRRVVGRGKKSKKQKKKGGKRRTRRR